MILDYYYSNSEQKFYIFGLQKGKEVFFFERPFSTSNFKNLKEEMLSILDMRKEKRKIRNAEINLVSLGKKLYDKLIPDKLKIYLKNNPVEYLTIIPTEVLHSLPLELIYDDQEKCFWGIKYAMTRAFNLQTLRAAIAAEKENQILSALIISDPTTAIKMPYNQLHGGRNETEISLGLDFALIESKNIYEILQKMGFKIILLQQKDAEKSEVINILNDNLFSIIHFAGHAIFNRDNPTLSFLLLREGEMPVKLYANEIASKISFKGYPIIFLSACETGGIDTKIGDEVIGLARGMIEAGTLGIIIAGWRIFDESSEELTRIFYHNFIFRKKPLAEALRLARLHVHSRAKDAKTKGIIYASTHQLDLLHWGAYRFYGVPFISFQ
ncbi:hypothetical protein LCGC14_1945290 [marine sediment metagenome]|uniref:CHAT domain-containing protein n=1 Tax=marine sediment metagenome TaxID=412755 RepID=A0A0F9HXC9_9ZZZZ